MKAVTVVVERKQDVAELGRMSHERHGAPMDNMDSGVKSFAAEQKEMVVDM